LPHPLLTAPIGRSLLTLAGPTTAFMGVQILVVLAEIWLIAQLGREALAAYAIAYPLIVFVMNVSSGGLGGAVAAAMARALGRGRLDDARALVLHTIVLAVAFGAVCTLFAWTVAPSLYRLLGAEGTVLRLVRDVSDIWFSGVVIVWLVNFLSAVLRGGGNAALPARIGFTGTLFYLPLAFVLTLGAGNWPGLGVMGFAIAGLASSGLCLVLQLRALWGGVLGFKPALTGIRLQRRLFGEILGVGLAASMATLLGNLNAIVLTGLVGPFGTAALAALSLCARLENMMGAIAYGIGTGMTTLIGVAAGAGAWARAVRVAWIGSMIAAAAIGTIGLAIALLPESWSRLFTDDAAVLAASVAYLTRVSPFLFLYGLGLSLHFASQARAA
jgi:Na+-driven multidrug efflux pump